MSNKKTVLLIPEFFSSGGTKVYFNSLIEFYKTTDFRVIILLEESQAEFIENDKALNDERFIITIRKEKWRTLKKFPYCLLPDYFFLLRLYRKYRFSVATLSIHSPGTYLAIFMLPVKVNYILHSQIKGLGRSFFKRRHFLKMFRSPEKKIIGVSKYTEKQIGKFWKYDYTMVIPNHSRFNGNQRRYNYQNRIILTFGHISKAKNPQAWLDTAIYALNKTTIKNLKFLWIGTGNIFQYKNLVPEEFKEDILLKSHNDNVSELLGLSLVYFHPSLIENLSLSIIEAMSFSLPIVAFNAGGNSELIDNGINGAIVFENDPAKFSRRILEIIESNEIYEKMSEASFRKYTEEHMLTIWQDRIHSIHQ